MAPNDETNNRATKATGSNSGDADLAQAYRDLARGEQAATNLENNLSNLESRLDAILAALEANVDQQASPAAEAAQADESPQHTTTTNNQGKAQGDSNGDVANSKKEKA